MHLESVQVVGFRSCDSTTIDFDPHLTVLVGENNGGKSNVIEAVRLLTAPSDGRRTRYPEPEDLRFTRTECYFTIRRRFGGLPAQQPQRSDSHARRPLRVIPPFDRPVGMRDCPG